MTGYYISILHGAGLTALVAVLSLCVAIVLGMLGACAKLSGSRFLRAVGGLYALLVRGIPELVLILLVFYGGAIGLNMLLESMGSYEGISPDPFIAGVLIIGFIYGAYMTEVFRGGIQSIPRGQLEAAWAFGMSRTGTFWRITLPQMVRYSVPSFTNSWMALLKATSLVSLIGLQDMTYLARQAGSATREPFLFILTVAGIYLVFTSISFWVLRKINDRYSLGVEKVQL